MTDRC